MRRIVALALPLLFLSLMTIQANAVVTPVEVERVKDCCFMRVRGAHHVAPDSIEPYDSGFLFYYKNIEPQGEIHSPQDVKLWFHIYLGDQHDLPLTIWFYGVCPGDVIDCIVRRRPYGYHMEFIVEVYMGDSTVPTVIISDTVVIPPPPCEQTSLD
jgi:hypothetical protein